MTAETIFSKIPTRGRLIVFEGLDRAGKTTQVTMVENAKKMRFPSSRTQMTDDPVANLLNEVLLGKTEITQRSLHLLFSADRWARVSDITDALDNGVDVVIDRYAYSGVAYTIARYVSYIPDMEPHLKQLASEELGSLMKWAVSTEVGLPTPDIVFYFDADPHALALRTDYGQGDIHEKATFQGYVRGAFLLLLGIKHDIVRADSPELVSDVHTTHGDVSHSENALLFPNGPRIIYVDATKTREDISNLINLHLNPK